MSWTEIDIGVMAPGMPGDNDVIDDLVANHNEIYATFAPPLLPGIERPIAETQTSPRVRWRWRIRGNADGLQVRAKVYADATTANGTVTLACGAASGSATVIFGGAAEYTITVTPSAGDPLECTLSLTAGASGDVTVYAVMIYLVATSAAAGTLSSGYRRGDGILGTAGDAVASEHVQRLLRGPGQVLRDRPHPVVSHVRDAVIAPKGSGFDWSLASTTDWATVGELTFPRVCEVPRTYTIDLYLADTGTAAEVQVKIGAWTWDIATSGWSSTTVRLGPGPHTLTASVTPGSGSDTARILALQVWRLDT